jgi:hypothetical protein
MIPQFLSVFGCLVVFEDTSLTFGTSSDAIRPLSHVSQRERSHAFNFCVPQNNSERSVESGSCFLVNRLATRLRNQWLIYCGRLFCFSAPKVRITSQNKHAPRAHAKRVCSERFSALRRQLAFGTPRSINLWLRGVSQRLISPRLASIHSKLSRTSDFCGRFAIILLICNLRDFDRKFVGSV